MNAKQGTAWVTGASSGIGYALALKLASIYEKVIVTARNLEKLEELSQKHTNILPLPADLTSEKDFEAINTYFHENKVQLDLLVVNAGNCTYMDKGDINLEAMRKLYDINLFSAVKTMDVALPYLQASSQPHVVVVSSMSVYLPFTRAEYYGSSKAALTYFFRSLAVDYKPLGIDISIVYPGFVDTPLTQKNAFKMPFLVTTEKAANEIVKVIRKRPREYAFPKQFHYALKLLGLMPGAWSRLHKSEAWS